jgi:TetR/AcrR family transcriptional repressor of nem operon
MARIKTFDEDQALEAAMLLFWEKGYEAVSIQALEQAMELNRTSIYNAFGNKRALFQHALNRYLQLVLSRFLVALAKAPSAQIAIKHVLNEVINLHFNEAHPGGCMVVLSLLESHQHDKKTKTQLDSALKQLRDAIFKRLEQGVVAGDLPKDFECRTAGDEITAVITGMIVMAKANISKKALERIVLAFLSNVMP